MLLISVRIHVTTQSRIICAVKGAHSQLWGTTIPVCFPYAPRISMTRDLAHLQLSDLQGKLDLYAERLIYREKECLYAERMAVFSIEIK